MYMAYKSNMGSTVSTPNSSVVSTKSTECKEDTPKLQKPPLPPKPSPESQQSQGPKDLMISYSHADTPFMKKLREKLEESGISVWVDIAGLQAGVDFLNKIGQAIIDSKLFISIVSSASVKSKYCKDELALAYISSSSIFPIALEKQESLYPLMDTGMKLQLASYKWSNFVDEDKFEESFSELLSMLQSELKQRAEDDESKADNSGSPDKKKEFKRSMSRKNIYRKAPNYNRSFEDNATELLPTKFWKDRFNKDQVDWNKFVDALTKTFAFPMKKLFSDPEEEKWLMDVLFREMEVGDDNILHFDIFESFCVVDDEEQPLWKRIEDQARESYAMKEVFDMDSSVRVEAIENLAKYRSAPVIQALQDLLTDPDANVRAVAAISLARTEANDDQSLNKLLRTLMDKDRLVREAGCLALGHLHAEQAVKKLLHMWRNDVISHVREAAAVALQQIGGVEVEQAMHVTKVLADEIRQLTEDNP
ncbi:uncharacterized protein LOC126825147 [Patella vulgata]|uniref:uncharacterized protein LOC126825147 n=1 Tax=Patella vulgata TaxID=6465 RepID=UPI00217FE165|nr:uncharacterized protein LOC126825147 [Patella vulgata]XP_050410608.1 uncharacterized protein LOC126825147 [Patella vulgata]XP_050410609.1 uncharacterized protein LOC126825147 [Patella vulgata]